jgi:YVTN family beta-propeller protein
MRGGLVNLAVAALVVGVLSVVSARPAAAASPVTFSYSGALQTFTVPAGVTSVTVTAVGAEGGTAGVHSNNSQPGGVGASIQGQFSVTPGDVLSVLVGGAGETPNTENLTSSGGGGGGSFVWRGRGFPALNGTSLLVAAGGGGGGGLGTIAGEAGFDASLSTAGTYGCTDGVPATAGGTNGNGGGAATASGVGAGGGGGVFSGGAGGGADGGGGGQAIHTGAAGGIGATAGLYGRGGFGGGGGSSGPLGGGGGGYSGGGGGGALGIEIGQCGGGGGSFNGGANQMNDTARRGNGNGQVTIAYTATAPVSVTATLAVGRLPTGVVASATRAYVANSQANTVSVIDTTQSPPAVVDTIAVGTYPNGLALSPDGSQLYVANYLAASLTIIRTSNDTVQFVVPVGSRPDGVAVFNNFVFVANLASGTVSRVDPNLGRVAGTIALPSGAAGAAAPSGLVVSPPSGVAPTGTLYVDDARNGVTLQVTLPSTGAGSVAAGVHPAYISVAGSLGYVASPGDNSIKVLSLSTAPPTALTSVAVGAAPYGVVADPAKNVVLATSSGANTVTAIDSTTNTVIGSPVAVGHTPDTVAVSPDGATAFVTNEADNTISVLNIT